ncbi:helix-turn-helix domain-containing protein [Novipirellula artificiosorum]|nr:helix-turn-helix domain-containing protein [Novipirellula artificiosorum]
MSTEQLEDFDAAIERLGYALHLAERANNDSWVHEQEAASEKPYFDQYCDEISGARALIRQMANDSNPMVEYLAEGCMYVESVAGRYLQREAVDWLDDARLRLSIEETKNELFGPPRKINEAIRTDIFSVADAASYLDISQAAVRNAFNNGSLDGKNVGQGNQRKQLRFTKSQLDAFVSGASPQSKSAKPPVSGTSNDDDLFPEFK